MNISQTFEAWRLAENGRYLPRSMTLLTIILLFSGVAIPDAQLGNWPIILLGQLCPGVCA